MNTSVQSSMQKHHSEAIQLLDRSEDRTARTAGDVAQEAVRFLNRFSEQHRSALLMNALCAMAPYKNQAIQNSHTLLKTLWLQRIGPVFPSPELRITMQEPVRNSTRRLMEEIAVDANRGQLITLLHHLNRRCRSGEVQSIEQIHRYVLRVLRHPSRDDGVSINHAGWASTMRLLEVINSRALRFQLWRSWTERDLIRQVNLDEGERLQIKNGSIRVRYGHSIDGVVPGKRSEPPETLFHGTSEEFVEDILTSGLHSQGRYLVHLTSNFDYASAMAARFEKPVVLRIQALETRKSAVLFWQATKHVWQSTPIPARFIGLCSQQELKVDPVSTD